MINSRKTIIREARTMKRPRTFTFNNTKRNLINYSTSMK